MDLAKKVGRLLEELFVGATVTVECSSAQKVSAIIVSPEFEGRSDRARQQQVWGRLTGRLSGVELQNITVILTSTPEEDALLSDDEWSATA